MSEWTGPLLLTLQLMLVSVTVATAVGIVGAWAAVSLPQQGRWGRTLRGIFFCALLAAVATPLILHAAAWEATAGKFGWGMLTQTGTRIDAVTPNATAAGSYGFFSGLVACGWIHGVFGAALVCLATWHGTERVSATIVDHSRMECGPLRRWWSVRLPLASPWWISAMLATAALAATEMTVVDLYGFQTLADRFYLYHAVDPSWQALLLVCFVPLAIVGGMLTWALISRRRLMVTAGSGGNDRDDGSEGETDSLPLALRVLATGVVIAVMMLVVAVPGLGLIVKAGHDVRVVDGTVQAQWSAVEFAQRMAAAPGLFAEEYQWTALLGLLCGATAVMVAWPAAAVARTHPPLERLIDVGSILLVALPGPLVGLAVVSFFQLDFPGLRTMYQQTLIPTVIALLVRAAPAAYWVLRAGYRSIDPVIFDAARMETSWLRRLWAIDRPLLVRPLIAAMLVAGIVASGDVPATLPVIPPGVTTVGVRLFGLLHSGARYQEAALALWYVAAVVMIAVVGLRQGFQRRVTVS